MPTTYTQPSTLGDLLLHEVLPPWSRQKGTLTGGNRAMGTVLAKVSGKYQILAPGGTGAEKIAVAVLAESVDASAADKPAVVIARGAVLAADALVWPAGITDPQKATALAELDALGLVVSTPL